MAQHGAAHDVAISDARRATQPLTHHGRTTAAWVGSAIALVGFTVSTVGFILPGINWAVIWAGLVIVGISAIVGGVLRNMGMGAKES